MSVSEWVVRLVQDTILPTQPVRAGEDDAIAITRENLLRESQARMPPAFQHPVTRGGFALEFTDAAGERSRPLRWRNAVGAEPIGTGVYGNRAEVSWRGSMPPRATDLALLGPDGRELARIEVAPNGAPILTTAAAVRSWYWVGVECEPAPNALSSRAETPRQLGWRLLSGAPVPASWRQDNRWPGGHGFRLDIPIPAGVAGSTSHALALVDSVSGWALVSTIAVVSGSPTSPP